jgi:type IV pilus assembly protein PilN
VDRSQYLNSIFARKAFSWTTVFSDMEKLMPPGLHVVSIAPQLDKDNQLEVHILVGGESRDRALTLVRNLEKTPRFRDVTLRSDVTNTVQNERGATTGPEEERDLIRFDIVARYVPAAQQASTQEAKSEPKSGSQTVAQSGGRQ